MTNAAHMRGPWEVTGHQDGEYSLLKVVERSNEGSIPKGEDEANARLIAAAPEQHEALAIAEEMLSAIADGKSFPAREYMERLHRIRKAIAKATGST
ncbi:MAG TPA: hypothetical protein VI756_02900 [Blastocatellia bacterium]